MIGAIDFLNHWRAICRATTHCKSCRIGTYCPGGKILEMTDEEITAFVRNVEMNFERKKKFGGYPEDGEA